MSKPNTTFIGCLAVSLVSIVAADFALGESAEYLNAYEVLRRSLPWHLPQVANTYLAGQRVLGASALGWAWSAWLLEASVVAVMLQAVLGMFPHGRTRPPVTRRPFALKKVLVTGGTRGIGRALAEQLVQEGCEVMVCGSSRDGVARVQADLGVRGIVCDLTAPSDVARLASAVHGELGGLDVLINNAGVQHEHDLTIGLDLDAARRELEINLMAPVALIDALLPLLMTSTDAVIANVTSALAFAPAGRAPVYCASKAGLAAFTRCLRQQLTGSNVRVVEIVPPLVATDMTVGRQAGAISTDEMARAMLRGLEHARPRVLVGKARVLAAIQRITPSLAERLMNAR